MSARIVIEVHDHPRADGTAWAALHRGGILQVEGTGAEPADAVRSAVAAYRSRRAGLNATARRSFVGTCGHAIRAGERMLMFRERALSYREAQNAGTMYPMRKWCSACASRPARR